METHFPEMENSHSRLARERVLADLRALTHDAEELLKATAGDISEKAAEAGDPKGKGGLLTHRQQATDLEDQRDRGHRQKAEQARADQHVRHSMP